MDNMHIYTTPNDENGFPNLKTQKFYGECLKAYMFKNLILNKL